jgi:hypothetical protein
LTFEEHLTDHEKLLVSGFMPDCVILGSIQGLMMIRRNEPALFLDDNGDAIAEVTVELNPEFDWK